MDIKVDKKEIPLSDRKTPMIVQAKCNNRLFLVTEYGAGYILISLKTDEYVKRTLSGLNANYEYFSGSVTLTQ